MLSFLLGAIGGGMAAYHWHDNIREFVSGRVPELRTQAADVLGNFGGRAGEALDRARTRIDAAVRTGQQRLRPAGTAENERHAGMRSSGPREAT